MLVSEQSSRVFLITAIFYIIWGMRIFVCAGMVPAVFSENMKRDAIEVGRQVGENGHTLLQGGNDDGLMGFVYREFLKYSYDCEMIVPAVFKSDLENLICKKAHITKNLAERLGAIVNQSDKIVVLPGGTGTLGELLFAGESRWLGEHQSEILVINSDGYFNGFKQQLRTMSDYGYNQSPNKFTVRFLEGMQNKKLSQCTFCDRDKEVVLMQSDNFYVVADKYATKDGHLCICTKKHCNSANELTSELYSELVNLKEKCKGMLSDIYKDVYSTEPICAEHGSDKTQKISSKSIDHLHWHITFVDKETEQEMITESEMQEINSRAELKSIAGSDSYIWYEDGDGKQHVTIKQMPKQYLRGVFARKTPCENDFIWNASEAETKKIFARNEASTIAKAKLYLQSHGQFK